MLNVLYDFNLSKDFLKRLDTFFDKRQKMILDFFEIASSCVDVTVRIFDNYEHFKSM